MPVSSPCEQGPWGLGLFRILRVFMLLEWQAIFSVIEIHNRHLQVSSRFCVWEQCFERPWQSSSRWASLFLPKKRLSDRNSGGQCAAAPCLLCVARMRSLTANAVTYLYRETEGHRGVSYKSSMCFFGASLLWEAEGEKWKRSHLSCIVSLPSVTVESGTIYSGDGEGTPLGAIWGGPLQRGPGRYYKVRCRAVCNRSRVGDIVNMF